MFKDDVMQQWEQEQQLSRAIGDYLKACNRRRKAEVQVEKARQEAQEALAEVKALRQRLGLPDTPIRFAAGQQLDHSEES